jgi:hypothetical protein
MMREAGWDTTLLDSVGYYRCDGDYSDRIGSFDLSTPLATIAEALAWYVHDTYTAKGEPVDLIGHSLGGLLIRYAMTRIAAGDSAYPSSVLVHEVVTLSSPFLGYGDANSDGAGCATPNAVGCTDLAPGSAFITALSNPVPADQGWTVVGSLASCDLFPGSDSTGVSATYSIVFQNPCYRHTAYLLDTSTARDAVGPADHRHSLALVMSVLSTGHP